jgi:putative redox protein
MNTCLSEQKEAKVVWQGNSLQFSAELGSGYRFDVGSPAGVEAGSPMEFLLAGVAGCTAMDVVSTLRKMRQPVTGLEVAVSGTRASDYPMVYTDLNVTYIVKGDGVDPHAVERAIALSRNTYCSASVMFERAGARLTSDYRIEPSSS